MYTTYKLKYVADFVYINRFPKKKSKHFFLGQIFSSGPAINIHLNSCELPQKGPDRFSRLQDTNKRTDKQNIYKYKYLLLSGYIKIRHI